jgi:hypothetical protein
MRVVTSGSHYIDIDAYAGAIAYAERELAPAKADRMWLRKEIIQQDLGGSGAPLE